MVSLNFEYSQDLRKGFSRNFLIGKQREIVFVVL